MTCHTLDHVNQASIKGDMSKISLQHTVSISQVCDLIAGVSMQAKYGKWSSGKYVRLEGAI